MGTGHDGEHDYGDTVNVPDMPVGEELTRECTHANCDVTCTMTRNR
ncbi:MAG TPA: hypothetical protein VLG40_01415 [Candidatus Saccharimonas sp.]|nr:hypothetical protein [Candidatus Saccharimonas sp.]